MKAVLILLLLTPLQLISQPKVEIREITGVVKSFEPGLSFAFQYLYIEVDGKPIGFMFNPDQGQFLYQRIKPGDNLTFRARIDPRGREWRKKMEESNRPLPWYMFTDLITAIRIDNQWIELPEESRYLDNSVTNVFIGKQVIGEYKLAGLTSALVFEGGLVATYLGSLRYPGSINAIKVGDRVSFGGYQRQAREGYKYPIESVKEVYLFQHLIPYTGELYSYLFKQNSVCIGARFNIDDGKKLDVSFPTEEATRIKEFLSRNDGEVQIFSSNYKPEGQLHPIELHALISGTDSLFIKKFGFYGGADGQHEHNPVEVSGKITRINLTPKGNVSSLIIDSDYYVEIDAMMAQQLSLHFQKGKQITISGKQRIRKEGEIYQKNYHIVVPERLTIDGKTFSVFEP